MKDIRSYSVLFFTFFIFMSHDFLLSNPSSEQPKIKGKYCFHVPFFSFSRQFVENTLQNNPMFCLGLAGSIIGGLLYPDKLEQTYHWIKTNRTPVYITAWLGLALIYLNKSRWLVFPELEEKLNNSSDSMESLMKFSKSGVRIFGPGQIKTRFADVAGLQTAKEDLQDIIMFLKNPKKFHDFGAHVPKGILLTGAPGNGKTLLARALAGEVSCPFLYISASEFIEALVGVGSMRIRHLFSIARELAPCIIFIDEIDTIGRKRSAISSSDGDQAQTLNQLLVEMDGFEQQKYPIIIIGATNRPDILDESLIRPGRFDRSIEINAPFFKDRCQVLQLHLSHVKTDSQIDIAKIARGTVGFSCAELAALVNEAAILALRDHAPAVTMYYFDQARDYMLLGREVKGLDIDADELWETAVHEAGHALAHVFQEEDSPLYKVTIVPRGKGLGWTQSMDVKERYNHTDLHYLARIVSALAGSVAEEMILGTRANGASSDLEVARKLATEMVMRYGMTEEFKDITFAEYIYAQVHLPDHIATKLQYAVAKIINECRVRAEQIISEHKDILLLLAAELMKQGTVPGDQVYKMCGVAEPALIYSMAG